ncbi:kinase-like protein [Dendrothele bispora CBS 962.96]|uniref:Kinase-like protein n=1 Tax=Dendrothele bispora (strain CBS 962.96) TaxID=1314807 RepID=A0A4S8M6S3_DENBC|nr:kinase-like protein [Dendrothele bispora CBS 962.96]
MNPEGHRSFLGQSAKSAVNGHQSDSRPEKPRLVTEDVDQPFATSPESLVFSTEAKGQNVGSKPLQNRPTRSQSTSQAASLSPAAMFLSSFAAMAPAKVTLPDDEGEVVGGFTLGGVIGYGGFSTIRRAFSTSGGAVAVKIVRRSDLLKDANPTMARKRLDHEAEIWSSLSHEHILPLFTSVHTSYADFFFTLLCPAGSLFDILKRDGRPALPQDDAGMMFRQVVRGINYLHEVVGIVHRDIKLENVLVDESGVCRITDFGLSRKIGEDVEEEEESAEEPGPITTLSISVSNGAGVHRAASVSQSHFNGPVKKFKTGLSLHESLIRPPGHGPRHRNSTTTSTQPPVRGCFQPGSLPYAAPELLGPPQISAHNTVHPAQDIWALGIMLYALLTGRFPFTDTFEPRLQLKIIHGVYEIPPNIGPNAERVLRGCLDPTVQSRWNILMVDEVAWGIGWGTDVSVPIASDEELRRETLSASMSRSTSQSAARSSRSKSRPADIVVPSEWEHGDIRSPGSVDAASRRSISRTRRSLSRAPAVTDRSSSARSADRSMSRPASRGRLALHSSRSGSLSSSSSSQARSPSLSALEVEIVDASSPSSSSVGVVGERGRRLRRRDVEAIIIASTSRSPSPSAVPTTPIDSDFHAQYPTSRSPVHADEEYDYSTAPSRDQVDGRELRLRERGRKPMKDIPENSGIRGPPYWGRISSPPDNLETLLDENEPVNSALDESGFDQDPKRDHTPFQGSPGPIVYSRSDGGVSKDTVDMDGHKGDSSQRPYYSYSTPRPGFGKQRAGSTPPSVLSSMHRFSDFPRPSPPHSRASYSRAHSRDGLPTMSGLSGVPSISGLPVILDTKTIFKNDSAGF